MERNRFEKAMTLLAVGVCTLTVILVTASSFYFDRDENPAIQDSNGSKRP